MRRVGRSQIPASVTTLAAPFPEPALPARSLIPAITGADAPVEIVVTSGDKPLRSTCRFAIFVRPNDAPCLACLSTGQSIESMSANARVSMPASTQVRCVNASR